MGQPSGWGGADFIQGEGGRPPDPPLAPALYDIHVNAATWMLEQSLSGVLRADCETNIFWCFCLCFPLFVFFLHYSSCTLVRFT